MPLKSVFDKTTNFFRGGASSIFSSTSTSATSSTAGLRAASTASRDVLFPKVNPDVDGPDCDADCASCTVSYPKKFVINEDHELYGNIKPWATHVLVATGKSDWYRSLALERGSVMDALMKSSMAPKNGRLMISASNMIPPPEYETAEKGHQPTTVLVLPSFTFVEHVRPDDVRELVDRFIELGPTSTTPMDAPSTSDPTTIPTSATANGSLQPDHTTETAATPAKNVSSINHHLKSRPCPHAYLILLCSNKTRDARCGQSAPILRKEFERHLRPLGLQRDLDDDQQADGVGIYFVSHLGGHKYAANVLIYRRDAQQAIWLARVRPEDCEAIVKYTVLQGKVVKPERQLRGGFDRQRGVVSW